MLYWLIFASLTCALDEHCRPQKVGPMPEKECVSRALEIMQSATVRMYAGCFEVRAKS